MERAASTGLWEASELRMSQPADHTPEFERQLRTHPPFPPHDVRETALRLVGPVPRQHMLNVNGTQVNTADVPPPRRMPHYLLIMDVAFSGLLTEIARNTVGSGIPHAMINRLPTYLCM